MKSMTGYGEGTAEGRSAKVIVQIRTLNHRHLDIQLRVPREYLPLEEEMRRAVRQRVSRGRVELFANRLALKGRGRNLVMNEHLLGQYFRTLRRVKRKFGLEGELDLSLFPTLPEIFQIRDEEVRPEDEKGLLLRALESALRSLDRSRGREGRQLQSDVRLRVAELRRISRRLEREAGKIQARFKDSVLPKGFGESLEPQREASEAGNMAFKGDIHEEVVRLKSHVGELGRLVRGLGPVGKQVDFLLQEIHRELNTISSKAPQLPVVQLVLEGKEKVEKVREQAQNVE